MTELKIRRRDAAATIRSSIDAFLDSPKIKGNPKTLRAYTNALDWAAEVLGPGHVLAEVADAGVGEALTELWGTAKSATWNGNRAAVGSWLAWCQHKQQWTAPALPASAERRHDDDDAKAVSR